MGLLMERRKELAMARRMESQAQMTATLTETKLAIMVEWRERKPELSSAQM